MKKDPLVFIGHILDSIEIIERYSEGMSEVDLMGSVDLQDKIIRRDEGYSGPPILRGRSRICLACSDGGHPRAEAKAAKDSRRIWIIGKLK